MQRRAHVSKPCVRYSPRHWCARIGCVFSGASQRNPSVQMEHESYTNVLVNSEVRSKHDCVHPVLGFRFVHHATYSEVYLGMESGTYTE